MTNEEMKKDIKNLIKKCVYFDICDFVDVVYTHFEKIGVYDYKSIDNIIKELQQYVILKNN